ncbi:gephyrin-like molybdotransferase receptor GlpR [Corynebacterium aquatimens]|uniref:Heme exporter protein D n=1 Tax=Corynebacterium aquatimens TaxID=1190508 RepID=A0A931GQS5_9CORY|nr:gephyrin-like molybdotransferase receptor GlpR [Corynebacterium aquatimens]MBG6121138.1 heme exporter protein D [Corynebacterium aquatimens]WJY66307.1 hypothetical protein CAQUA_08065 [Corynebacterium aquatimens]
MSGSLSLIIILIVVVWVIVLAPIVFGSKTPIRRSGEGFSETRVLHEGGTAAQVQRRKPRLSKADIHRHEEPAGQGGSTRVEIAVPEDRKAAETPRELEVLEGSVIEDTDSDTATTPADQREPTDARDLEVVEELDGLDEEAVETLELYDDDVDAPREYDIDDSYESPEDFGYGSTVVPLDLDDVNTDEAEKDADAPESASAGTAASENAEDHEEASDAPAQPAAAADADAEDRASASASVSDDASAEPSADNSEELSDELTEEDLALARARRGRGWWDPEAEQRRRLDRQKRRQRTVIGLIVCTAVALSLAIVFGGWVWLAPVVTLALMAWYLITLRTLVEQEKALRARRLRQLRRARLGVVSSDEHAPLPSYMRRPGAVIVEIDDESPDFANLTDFDPEAEPLVVREDDRIRGRATASRRSAFEPKPESPELEPGALRVS